MRNDESERKKTKNEEGAEISRYVSMINFLIFQSTRIRNRKERKSFRNR